MALILYALSFVPFYLVGAFPTGYLIARAAGVNIANEGSGNVGATNVSRVLGKKAGLLTLVGDLTKGMIAVFVARLIGGPIWYEAAVAVVTVCGHCFSVPPYLKGGKGVATSLGALFVLSPFVALGAIVVFAALFFFKKIVSLASVTSALIAPVFSLLLENSDHTSQAIIAIAAIIVYRHKENLNRLVKGTESSFSLSKGKS